MNCNKNISILIHIKFIFFSWFLFDHENYFYCQYLAIKSFAKIKYNIWVIIVGVIWMHFSIEFKFFINKYLHLYIKLHLQQ